MPGDMVETTTYDEPEWIADHIKYGYLSKNKLIGKGYTIKGNVSDYCTICAGLVTKTLGSSTTEMNDTGELIHVDLIGPIYNQYGLVCIDNKSKFITGYILSKKSQASLKAIDIIKVLNNILHIQSKSIKRVRADNEFRTIEFQEFCEQQGILIEYTAPHSSYQNGNVENANKFVKRKLKLLLIQSGIPKSLWIYAFKHAIFLLNYLPRNNNNESP